MEEVFQATYAFEQFVLEYAQYHLNKTTPNLSINSQEIGKGKKKKIYYLQCRSVDFHVVIVLQEKNPKFFCQKKKLKLKRNEINYINNIFITTEYDERREGPIWIN